MHQAGASHAGIRGHDEGFYFYSKDNGEPWKGFEKRSDGCDL